VAWGGSPLALLRGHEATLLRLVADFVGVRRGRPLRRRREAAVALRIDLTERLGQPERPPAPGTPGAFGGSPAMWLALFCGGVLTHLDA